MESQIVIPVKEWTHIALVFENRSTDNSSLETAAQYMALIYVNGRLDISVGYPRKQLPLSNPHPLHLFKDTSHQGADIPALLLMLSHDMNHRPQGVCTGTDSVGRWADVFDDSADA